jgi:hypothetical protein
MDGWMDGWRETEIETGTEEGGDSLSVKPIYHGVVESLAHLITVLLHQRLLVSFDSLLHLLYNLWILIHKFAQLVQRSKFSLYRLAAQAFHDILHMIDKTSQHLF